MAISNNFSYQVGPCSTNIPWHRPDPYNLTKWRESLFEKITNFKNYKIWMLGAAIEGARTWDVDFVITGELEDKSKLQEIMVTMINLGFDNRILIDVWWYDACREYIEKGHLCKKMQVACQEVLDTGACTGKNCLKPRKIKADFIVVSNKVIKNKKLIKSHKTAQRIHENLWLCEGRRDSLSEPFFTEKHKKKTEETLNNKTYPILITPDTNFYEYICWP